MKPLTSMDKDKSPGNDGITKELYIKFWDVAKEPLLFEVFYSRWMKYLSRRSNYKINWEKRQVKDLLKTGDLSHFWM